MNVSAIQPGKINSETSPATHPGKIRVLIADDHPVYRGGLVYAINQHTDMIVVGEADNGKRLVEMAKHHQPDVVLSDIKMPGLDGIAAIRQIVAMELNTRCLLLSQYNSDRYVADAIGAGASGYLVKKASQHEIIDAVLAAFSDHQYFCRFASGKLKKLMANSIYNVVPGPSVPSFSEKEKEIISLLCQEYSSSMIGKELFMSARTVEGYKAKIMNKIGVKTSVGVVLFAVSYDLYRLDNFGEE